MPLSNTFLDELKRRKVVRVAVVYAATAFVVLQAADLILPALLLPESAYRMLVLVALFGFPVALVLGWALELTPHGVRVTQPTAGDDATPPSLLGRRTLVATSFLVVLGVGLGAGLFLAPIAPDRARDGDEAAAAGRSIAVLPFADLSPDGNQKWFADGLAEEILTSLARLPELRVAGRSSSFLFAAGALDDRVIADTLGVAHLLKGSVRRLDDRLRMTAQLVRAIDGIQLWSESYDRDAAALLDVQRDVAEKVAAALDILLDDARREQMFAAGTRDVEAFEAFLRGRDAFSAAHRGDGSASLADANVWFERAMALDPGFAAPAFLHADRYGHFVVDGPGPVVGALELTGQQALERLRRGFDHAARGRDPQLRVVAQINHAFFSNDWRALPRLLDALEPYAATLVVDDPWGRHVPIVLGRLELARKLADRMIRWDRLIFLAWTQRIQVELAAGELEKAHALIAEARAVLPELPWFDGLERVAFMLAGDRDTWLARAGDVDEWTGYAAAVRGDAESALARAAAFDAARPWPETRLLRVYHELGDHERRRQLAARIDTHPAGAAMLLRELSLTGAALTFDPADTPNFTARMREAGVDPNNLRVMPRLNAAAEVVR